jgi:anti-sigma B factor antagonist
MESSIRSQGEAVIVSLEGEIDLESSPRARDVLLSAVDGGQPVFVDLAGVEYIDSSGVASLVEAYQRAREQGSRFGLVAVNAAALRVLKLARLDRVFPIFDTIEGALDGDG